MKKIIAITIAQLILASTALASGYGGYDQEYVEVDLVEITVTGGYAETCQISKANVKASVSVSGCEDQFVADSSCECKEVKNLFKCEYKQVISCTANYEWHY